MEIIKKESKEENREVVKEILSSITTSVTTGKRNEKGQFIPQIIPENGWAILAIFATSKQSYSINELRRQFRRGMHINTIRSMILRLKEQAWIKTYGGLSGHTRSERRYRITLEGMAVWEIYCAR